MDKGVANKQRKKSDQGDEMRKGLCWENLPLVIVADFALRLKQPTEGIENGRRDTASYTGSRRHAHSQTEMNGSIAISSHLRLDDDDAQRASRVQRLVAETHHSANLV
jgi:hypothetical protein